MDVQLRLTLHRLEQTAERVSVCLTLHNDSRERLHVPMPRALGLRFRNVRTGKVARKKLHSEHRLGGVWEGITLRPGERREVALSIVLAEDAPGIYEHCCHVEDCWRVELDPGEYEITCKLRLESDGYCLESQYDMAELRRIARADGATLWIGETESTPLRFVHDLLPVANAGTDATM